MFAVCICSVRQSAPRAFVHVCDLSMLGRLAYCARRTASQPSTGSRCRARSSIAGGITANGSCDIEGRREFR
eukprot:6177635-Pleurochrysis_carterae.AAC.2